MEAICRCELKIEEKEKTQSPILVGVLENTDVQTIL